MYSKNYTGGEMSAESISVPPQYSGNAIYRQKEQFREQPFTNDEAPSYREINQQDVPDKAGAPPPFSGTFEPHEDESERFRHDPSYQPPPPFQPGPPPPPPPPYQPPPPPPPPPPHRLSGLLDRFSSEDLLIYGAAALLVFRDQDDLLSLGILLLIILI